MPFYWQQIHFLFQDFIITNNSLKHKVGSFAPFGYVVVCIHGRILQLQCIFLLRRHTCIVADKAGCSPRWMEQWPVFSWPCCSAGCHLVWLPSPTRAQGSLLSSTNRQGSTIRLLTVTRVKTGEKHSGTTYSVKAERCRTLQPLNNEFSGCSGLWFLTERRYTSPFFWDEEKRS